MTKIRLFSKINLVAARKKDFQDLFLAFFQQIQYC